MNDNPSKEGLSHQWVSQITEGESISGSYLVKSKRVGTTRNGKTYISVVLADRSGDIDAKVWEKAQQISTLFDQGDVVEVEGDVESYRGEIQLRISSLALSEGRADSTIFIERAPGDPSEMFFSLKEIIKGVKDLHLRGLCERFLGDKKFVEAFKKAPAAKNFHHAYLGGLMEHTLSVCRGAAWAGDQYPQLNRDLLVASAFLHDIGKIRELSFDLQIDYTSEGRLLGHLVLGLVMLEEKLIKLEKFPPDLAVRLKHAILSHHGHYEFGSPKRPKFPEAFALYLIDDLDAKINGVSLFIKKDRQTGAWTDFNRLFERYFFKGESYPSTVTGSSEKDEEDVQETLFSTP